MAKVNKLFDNLNKIYSPCFNNREKKVISENISLIEINSKEEMDNILWNIRTNYENYGLEKIYGKTFDKYYKKNTCDPNLYVSYEDNNNDLFMKFDDIDIDIYNLLSNSNNNNNNNNNNTDNSVGLDEELKKFLNDEIKKLEEMEKSHKNVNDKGCCNYEDDDNNNISTYKSKILKRQIKRVETTLYDLLDSVEKDFLCVKPKKTVKKSEKNSPNKKKSDGEEEIKILKRPTKKVDIVCGEVKSITDLIDIINKNPFCEDTEYNINLEALHKIKEPLCELNALIGMPQLKQNIVDQLLYFIQNLHINGENGKPNDFMHTVIYGPPGTGKTEVAKIMGHIFSKLGILKKGTFKKVTRTDLVAGYLGQTAIKTSDVIKDALDGVLFIDEAYALGNPEKRDSFAKECIDTLCEALSDNKSRLMVIIAGYESELKDCFFSYNQGLESRFTWRFKIDDYKGEELYNIFLKKVGDIGWNIHDTDEDTKKKLNIEWFTKNLVYFKYFGRDIEALLSKIKICHSRRVFCKSEEEKRKITYADFIKGFELFSSNEEVKKRKEDANMKYSMSSLYI